jgi:DNA-binding transcriptional ArsR family regulator
VRQKVEVNLALSNRVRLIADEELRKEIESEIEAARRKPAGLTESISETLRQTYHSLSASDVRRSLVDGGFDLSEYSQPLATVSATLRRLAASGRVEATRQGRNVTYKWIGDR